MKKLFAPSIALLTFCIGLLLSSCGGSDATNAENKDTVSTTVESQPDKTGLRPDTMQTQLPKDTTLAKDTSK